MRKLLVLLFFFPIAGFCQENVDIVHYRFDINLHDTTDRIYVEADILGVNLLPGNQFNLDLVNIDSKTRKGMQVNKVEGAGVKKFEQKGDKLIIYTNAALEKGDSFRVKIDYSGIPADGLIISKNKYGGRTFFSDNWPNRAHHWMPCNDIPSDKASVEFIVTAPDHYQVVSNGLQIEETNLAASRKRTHWTEAVPIPVKVMVIGAARFAVELSGMVNNCIPVTSWVYPENRKAGFYDYALASEILPFFIELIGPYAFKKLANVESKTRFGGMENANTIFYSEKSIDGKRTSEHLIAHEIAHQWFGNMATEKNFSHLWLSESFATYMSTLFMENKYGKDTAVFLRQEDREEVIRFSREYRSPVVDPNPNYMELLNPNTYERGGFVLHMLRRQLGDSVFRKVLREYYSRYAGRSADTDDLRKVFEDVSGRDLKKFFEQWIYSPGIPKLSITWNYDASRKKVSGEVTQSNTVFEFPLKIEILFAGGMARTELLQVSGASTKFSYTVKEKPTKIHLDPDTDLLFERL